MKPVEITATPPPPARRSDSANGAARLEPVSGGNPIVASRRATFLAASASGQVVYHSIIVVDEGRLHLRQLNDRAGLKVNGNSVVSADLSAGDLVQLSSRDYRVIIDSTPPIISRETECGYLTPTSSHAPIDLHQTVTVIGSGEHADMRLNGIDVASEHAVIVRLNSGFRLWTVGETDTRVNSVNVRTTPLADGAVITIGGQTLLFSNAPETLQSAGTIPTDASVADVEPTALTDSKPAYPRADSAPPTIHREVSSATQPEQAPAAASLTPIDPVTVPFASRGAPVRVKPSEGVKKWGPLAFALVASREPESTEPDPTDETPDNATGQRRSVLAWVIGGLVILGAAAGGVWYLFHIRAL